MDAILSSVRAILRKAWPYAPVGYALIIGVHQVSLVNSSKLDPDVMTYMELATRFDALSLVGGAREPVWPGLLAVPTHLFGAQPWIPRLLGVAAFGFLVLATEVVVAKRHGLRWATAAGWVLAASPWLIFQSARGLREEAAAGLIIIFAAGVVSGRLSTRRAGVLAVLAGLAGMLRWDTVIVTLPTLLLFMVVTRADIRQWALALLVFGLIVAPLLVGNAVMYDDPFYHSNIHARFFRNIEFRGQPGFLTNAQVARNSFGGPPITWPEYIFGLHTTKQIVGRTVEGFENVPRRNAGLLAFYPSTPSLDPWPTLNIFANNETIVAWILPALAVVGAITVLRGPAWPLAMMLPLSIGIYPFISGLMDYRLAMNEIPLMVVLDIEALVVLGPLVRSPLKRIIGEQQGVSTVEVTLQTEPRRS